MFFELLIFNSLLSLKLKSLVILNKKRMFFFLPMLVHEFLLSNGESAEFVTKGVFILSQNDKEIGQKAS